MPNSAGDLMDAPITLAQRPASRRWVCFGEVRSDAVSHQLITFAGFAFQPIAIENRDLTATPGNDAGKTSLRRAWITRTACQVKRRGERNVSGSNGVHSGRWRKLALRLPYRISIRGNCFTCFVCSTDRSGMSDIGFIP
jgi:hypothetical protein